MIIKSYGNWGDLMEVGGKKIYVTIRNRKDHYMRKFDGWGIESPVIGDLLERGCTLVHIVVRNEGILEAKLDNFVKYGVDKRYEPHGPQTFLSERRMRWISRLNVRRFET